ncbi:MAG: O-methyltransferase [Peptococcaceae bacterium]|nr:O-methyltransferase [Peptococcaceae bacterium]
MFYPFALEQYLEELVPQRDPLLLEMEARSLAETIPIITPAVGNFLAWLVQVSSAHNMLEIGTAIGYSTLWLARPAQAWGGHVTTIDLNVDRQQRAVAYFSRAGLTNTITSLAGDARKLLPSLDGAYDLVFIDAAKGEYLEYLDLVTPLMASNGILVVDNVLFRGWVVPGSTFDPKYERMVAKLREFLARLNQNPDFATSVLPLGDGLAISRRRS